MNLAQKLYNETVTKEEIFYYVYGFLHMRSYREKFANELKKSLPRIILVPEIEKFKKISQAGRSLAEIHLNYENQPAPAEILIEGTEHNNYKVQKMKLSKDQKTLIYNQFITIKKSSAAKF